jgi:SAM-dependent methyltransferase
MTGFDPASFRDPSGRLFRHRGAVYRTCSPDARATFLRARDAGLLDRLTSLGLIVPSTLVASEAEGLLPSEVGAEVIRQPELPFVSYSYEWSFSMLRDAASATLRTLECCLDHGFVLKDATSFNVLFEGATARLVDVHSIEVLEQGALWAGYAQFCRAFLFPLLLMSYKGLDPRPLLLAGLGEIPVGEISRVLGWRDSFKPGVLVNVTMQQQLERRFAGRAEDVSRASGRVKYPLSAMRGQVLKLRRLLDRLRPPAGDRWTAYVETHTYGDSAVTTKEGFVRAAIEAHQPAVLLDLGTNTGQYARLARTMGARVVAVDVSSSCVDELYRRAAGDVGLYPLVADLTRPTPAIGWRLIERKSLLDRLRGDFVLALALIHHLRITGGIPLSEIVDLLTRLAPAGVIEWVGRDDPMVKRLLALRPDVYQDYSQENLERLLGTAPCRIEASADIPSSPRTLYRFTRR